MDRIKEFTRKLRKYEWAYKHLPKNFIFDIDMKEAMENELPVIDVYEQQIIDTINDHQTPQVMIYFFNGVFIVLVVMVLAVIARDFKDAKAGEAIR